MANVVLALVGPAVAQLCVRGRRPGRTTVTAKNLGLDTDTSPPSSQLQTALLALARLLARQAARDWMAASAPDAGLKALREPEEPCS